MIIHQEVGKEVYDNNVTIVGIPFLNVLYHKFRDALQNVCMHVTVYRSSFELRNGPF